MQRQALKVAASWAALGLLTAVTVVGAAAADATTVAKPISGSDLHDARYCEILELRGEVPDATVTVWNTIGLNDCPPEWWDGLDASAIAAERDDTAVILNGPRHFLMDAATADAGRTHSFVGVRLRKVATIPIHSSEELVQEPYTERTIERRNTWTWNAGRRVFELLAPDGSTYLMQSYSQMRDPDLTIAALPALGSRLDLPQGWSYRSRRLRRDLTLTARGTATIIQDDLLDTYQRLPRTDDAERRRVDVTGTTHTTGSPAPGTVQDEGTISGRPFGSGTITLVVTFADSKATGTFEIDSPDGSTFGTMAMTYVVSGNEIDFDGTAAFTGGTGKFRGIRGDELKAHDHNTLDGQSGSFTLDGFAEY